MNKVHVHGMAHITGGGLVDNVPRVLPKTVDAVFDRSTWETPAIYEFIEKTGKVDHEEMYRVFNMGIGYVIIVRAADADKAIAELKAAKQKAIVVGRIEKGTGKSVLIN
jgi:phosphoribosylformylglycinamidine cyclo-ligase